MSSQMHVDLGRQEILHLPLNREGYEVFVMSNLV